MTGKACRQRRLELRAHFRGDQKVGDEGCMERACTASSMASTVSTAASSNMCSTLSRDSCALGEAFFQSGAARKNTKQRRFERRAHLHWERQHAAEGVAAMSGELSLRQQTCYPSGECGSSDLARAAASRRSTFHCPFELGLTEAERACIAVRNTFLDISQPQEEPHRRRSAPVVASFEDTPTGAFLQYPWAKPEPDLDMMSVCTADTWEPFPSLVSEETLPSVAAAVGWSSAAWKSAETEPTQSCSGGFESDMSEVEEEEEEEDAAEDVTEQLSFWQPSRPDLPKQNEGCMVVRNTFLNVEEPKDDGSQRRRSAPVVVSLEDKGASALFLQPSEKKLDADVETASFCSTDSSQSLNLHTSDGMPSALWPSELCHGDDKQDLDESCVIIRNTFWDIQAPRVELPRRKSAV